MQRLKCYTIDLTKLKGNEDVHCPRCENAISPDDETEDAYTILETVMKGDTLDKITLKCNKCQTHICLTGFQLLGKSRQSI
ncbi:MAG TPA: hypothetical protein VMT42_01020 [candidate division Zixibacteria bacterium]|nr:hypothetical protein [candidate division Zixibacteria bacterium]